MQDPLILCAEIMDFLAIPYCIVGSYAVACYGVPRQTGDVDVLAVIDGDAAAVAKKLRGLGFEVSLSRADLLDPRGDLITIASDLPIQLIKAKYEYQLDAVRNAITVPYEGRELRVVSLEDLVLLKLKAGSPLDLNDIQSIMKVQGSNLDIASLMERARRIRVDRRLRALLAKTTLPGGPDA
ncbi:DUF6036 family nucleotidyltransferase [Desulforudis sp. 1088]|uniref:DUF6036 family nucleotidyltransferase n=1 Tax=unclassified Candidatus Desulforudis TaxID=2635950 RepID=UPI003CE456F7